MNLACPTRRDCLRLGAAALAAGLRPAGAAERRPNILFLFTDDQRFNTVGALGNPAVATPHLDRLVASGTAFEQCYIQGSTVGAVCICSRAQLLTGRGLWRAPQTPADNDGLTLWPQHFRQQGYTTFGTGKWHNGPWSFAQSFTTGGSIFFGGMSDHLQVPVHDFDPTGRYPREQRRLGDKFSSELFSDEAIRFLRTYDGDAPFFAYVAYTAPHDPRLAPPEYAAMYPPDRVEPPPNCLPEHPFDNGELKVRDEALAPWPRTPAIVKEHLAAYYAMITHVDAQIGRVLAALEESGRARETLVIFGADNGLAVGSHGLLGKQNLYEHSVRVPLILRGPGLAAGRREAALVYLHDLFPTTCELAGLPRPATVESVSLAPLLTGRTTTVRDSLFSAYRDVQRMVRDGEWKYLRYPRIDREQLFHLPTDPHELRDLSAEPAQADRLPALRALLARWQVAEGDPLAPAAPA